MADCSEAAFSLRKESRVEEDSRGVAGKLEVESDARVTRSLVGLMRARDVHLDGSAAGLVAAQGHLSIQNGGCGPVLANGGVTIRNGGCGPLIANGDVSIENGGTQTVLAAGSATIGPRALAGIVVSPRVSVGEGGRVLVSSQQALGFGAAAGVAFALVSRLLRR
jgi:hypothetical protein